MRRDSDKNLSVAPLGRIAIIVLFGGAILAAGLPACTKSGAPPETALVTKGRQVYVTHCTACHHPSDPFKDGSVGPAVGGSSTELLETRVLSLEYPPGYTPKRQTHLMPKLPQLRPDLPALHAFLNHR